MKALAGVMSLVVLLGAACGAELNTPEQLYQKALHLETAKADYKGAIPIYATIISNHAQNTAFTIKALYRQGVCYDKISQAEQAKQCAQKLANQYADAVKTNAEMTEWVGRYVKADEVTVTRQKTPSNAQSLGTNCVVEGQVCFDGTPLMTVTEIQPTFWLRNETSGRKVNAIVQYANGQYRICGLLPGRYGISVNVDSNTNNPRYCAGDYYSWSTFDVSDNAIMRHDINLRKIINLKEPQDNNAIMEKWGNPWKDKIVLGSPVRFSWASLGKNVRYKFSVERMSAEPYERIETVTAGTTNDNSVTIVFAPSNEKEFYQFTISGERDGRKIGILMTRGLHGEGWDYRFRVGK